MRCTSAQFSIELILILEQRGTEVEADGDFQASWQAPGRRLYDVSDRGTKEARLMKIAFIAPAFVRQSVLGVYQSIIRFAYSPYDPRLNHVR